MTSKGLMQEWQENRKILARELERHEKDIKQKKELLRQLDDKCTNRWTD